MTFILGEVRDQTRRLWKAKPNQVESIPLAGPRIDHATIGGDHRMIDVKAIQIEGHCRDPQSCKPDADHRPDSQEEVQRSAVIEGCGVEEQSTALAVSSHDVVSLFVLPELVSEPRLREATQLPNSMKPAEGPRPRRNSDADLETPSVVLESRNDGHVHLLQ